MMHAGSDDVGWRESGSKSGALGNALAILKEMDWLLLGGILMLATFGIHVLSGAVAGIPALEPVVGKQMFFLCIAFAAMIAVTLIDYRWINRVALILYGLNLITGGGARGEEHQRRALLDRLGADQLAAGRDDEARDDFGQRAVALDEPR